jgi:hypothetical protein
MIWASLSLLHLDVVGFDMQIIELFWLALGSCGQAQGCILLLDDPDKHLALQEPTVRLNSAIITTTRSII